MRQSLASQSAQRQRSTPTRRAYHGGASASIRFDIVAFGDTSIEEIEKLMEELRVEGLKASAKRINARYAHLTRTASASIEIIAESMSKWRVTEMEAAK